MKKIVNKIKIRFEIICKGKKYYVYADNIDEARACFININDKDSFSIELDSNTWVTKLEENWNINKGNSGKATSIRESSYALGVECPVCKAGAGLCCLINDLRRMHIVHTERFELMKVRVGHDITTSKV
jgi:hypothetical protein